MKISEVSSRIDEIKKLDGDDELQHASEDEMENELKTSIYGSTYQWPCNLFKLLRLL